MTSANTQTAAFTAIPGVVCSSSNDGASGSRIGNALLVVGVE